MGQLGEVMRATRQELGLSQARAAARAGLDPSTWNQVETGARSPSTATLERVATALDLSMADLFAGYKIPKEQPLLPLDLGGNGGSFEDLLEQFGLADTPLARDPKELIALFDSFETYEEARRLAAAVIEARQAINPILERRLTLPPGTELGQLNRLWSEAFARTAVAVLRHQAAADSEAERLRHLGEEDQAARVEEEAERLRKAA